MFVFCCIWHRDHSLSLLIGYVFIILNDPDVQGSKCNSLDCFMYVEIQSRQFFLD